MEKLKEAVWQTWLRSIKGGMGCGTPTEMAKEYGFTGPFAGLDKHFKDPLEIAWALEELEQEICFECGNRWRDHRSGLMGGIDCP
jgi:hypothetical protein